MPLTSTMVHYPPTMLTQTGCRCYEPKHKNLIISQGYNFYQRATCFARGRLVLRLLCGFRVCMCITLIMCTIITSYTLLPCDLTSQLWQFRWLLCVAAMSSLPQLWLWDGYREAEAT